MPLAERARVEEPTRTYMYLSIWPVPKAIVDLVSASCTLEGRVFRQSKADEFWS
jgi:hypothetical protein